MTVLNTHFGTLSEARMTESPLLARLRLARQGCRTYPLDDMDFILADLERSASLHRHAEHCTGDLSGRYLEFLAASMPHDDGDAARMDELFWRILKCQGRDGTFNARNDDPSARYGTGSKLFAGLLRYYAHTGNGKALEAARRIAEYLFEHFAEPRGYGCGSGWLTEPMALLFAETGDTRCLDYCRKIEVNVRKLSPDTERLHSHGLMTALRGLQLAAMVTGDASFNEQPERFRQWIQDKAVWADGNIPELFPTSGRNEGCSIADWVILNLNAGFLTGADEAYEKAERAMFNALAFSQLSNGRFSCRVHLPDQRGYDIFTVEAWCCCVHTGGLALVEFARHAVTLREDCLQVNLLVPGHYEFEKAGRKIGVDIATRYPEVAEALIRVEGAPEGMEVKIRIPSFVRNASVEKQSLPGGGCRYVLCGDLGYYLEEAGNGGVLKYGPLVMAPLEYHPPPQKDGEDENDVSSSLKKVIEGNIPCVRSDYPAIVPTGRTDDAGFLVFDTEPKRLWECFEEGPRSRITYGYLSVNVPLRFADDQESVERFYPMLNRTTIMKGAATPIVFETL